MKSSVAQMVIQRANEYQMHDVVGFGASAGSIEALKTFFSYMPEDSGLAFVVVLHLSPEYESRLAGVLQMDIDAGNLSLRTNKGRGKTCLRDPATQTPFNGRWHLILTVLPHEYGKRLAVYVIRLKSKNQDKRAEQWRM